MISPLRLQAWLEKDPTDEYGQVSIVDNLK
jgi:hypothetical protein